MLAGLTAPPGLVVDRYYRGAIVMIGDAMFAIPEAAILVIERARDAAPVLEVAAEDAELVAALITRGLLVRRAP